MSVAAAGFDPIGTLTSASPRELALVALAVVVFFGAATIQGIVRGRRGPKDRTVERDAANVWARPKDVRDLVVDARVDPFDRVGLGRLGSAAVAGPVGRSAAVVAPSGGGKTPRFVVPTVLRHDGPAVVASIKGDVLALTVDERRRRGPVWIFDPFGASGQPSCTWSPLNEVRSYGDALKVATWLAESHKADQRGPSDAHFWDTLGKNLLAPMLFAAAGQGLHIGQVTRWVLFRAESDVQAILDELGDQDALAHWTASNAREDRAKSSVYTTAETILDGFAHPEIRDSLRHTTPERTLTPARLLDEGGTLYLVAPESEQALLTTVFETLINSITREVERRSAALGGLPIAPRLLLMIDEAANVAPLRKLDKLASAGAGQGILLVDVWQNKAQISTIYGDDRARVILDNHTSTVYMAGIKDEQTLKYLSGLLGQFRTLNRSMSRNERGRSESTDWRDVDVAPPEYLRQLGADRALVIVGRYKPMKVQLPAWFEDDRLRALIDPAVAEAYDRRFAAAPRTRRSGIGARR